MVGVRVWIAGWWWMSGAGWLGKVGYNVVVSSTMTEASLSEACKVEGTMRVSGRRAEDALTRLWHWGM